MRKQPAILFHKKHTSEDEKDGNGDMIQNTNQIKITPA